MKCDGQTKRFPVRVAYFARYPGAGVPRVIPAAGGGLPRLIIDFKVKNGAGVGARPHKRLTLTLSQINQDRPLTATESAADLAPSTP